MMKVAGFSVLLTVMPLFPQPQPSGGNAPGCKPISDSVALQFEIEDSDSLKSDGKGPYRHNTDCIWAGIFAAGDAMLGSLRPGPPGVLSLPWDFACRGAKRTLHVNLDRPTPGSGAKPLGIIRATLIKLKIFYSFEGNSFHGLLDMPVGITAKSSWTQISVDNVDLLFGSDPVDACGSRLDAPKTTSATLTRLPTWNGYSICLTEASGSLMHLRRSSRILRRAPEAVVDRERAAVSINSTRVFGSQLSVR